LNTDQQTQSTRTGEEATRHTMMQKSRHTSGCPLTPEPESSPNWCEHTKMLCMANVCYRNCTHSSFVSCAAGGTVKGMLRAIRVNPLPRCATGVLLRDICTIYLSWDRARGRAAPERRPLTSAKAGLACTRAGSATAAADAFLAASTTLLLHWALHTTVMEGEGARG